MSTRPKKRQKKAIYIIFSSVYESQSLDGSLFFDKLPNILNVAVSRAQSSFLVFGDMDIFDPTRRYLPSGLLAHYLFAKEENEIIDIITPQLTGSTINRVEIKSLNSLHEHRVVLRHSFAKAMTELNITIDDGVIVVGSFNWLSASRTMTHYMREESSILYQGEAVAELIEKVLAPIRDKCQNQIVDSA